jgi:hypothetical protein
LRRACNRGLIPFALFNEVRVIHRDDLAAVRAYCVDRGYIAARTAPVPAVPEVATNA